MINPNQPTDNAGLQHKYNSVYANDAYKNFYTFGSFPQSKSLVEALPSWEGLSVLEIGCGQGELSAMLMFAGAKSVDAVDFSQEAVDIAERSIKLDNLRFICANFKDMKHRYDAVVMQGVLEHFDAPFDELDYIRKNLLNAKGSIVTSSPSFLNPRGFIWMAFQLMLDVPMSLSDLHFLCPFDLEEYCQNNNLGLKYRSVDQDWGWGQRTVVDFKKRLKNALGDAKLDNTKVDRFLEWFEKTIPYAQHAEHTGANIIYHIQS